MFTVAAGLVLLGSPGPWLPGILSGPTGMDGDGEITLALGGFALLLALTNLKRPSTWLDVGAAAALAAVASIGLHSWLTGGGLIEAATTTADPGWGLALVTVAALLAVATSVALGGHEAWTHATARTRGRQA